MEINITQLIVGFFGPLIGVFVGYILSKRWDLKKQEKINQEKRKRVLTSLREELRKINGDINDWLYKKGSMPNIDFPTGCYESSVNSGNFSLLDKELQSDFTGVYEKIMRIKSKQIEIQKNLIYPSEISSDVISSKERFRDIIHEFTEDLEELNKEIESLVKKLDIGS
ncbi:hypothetical protein AKJ51_03030 [candidate division MSBL1 archaeon SCGC-AAA382A20]|uniref:Uncharacterized protein n=1 Tax=candidate division MSBL1 archaeon SCGC-AAA382A20 TaxID=1698280 RepID=A0A133VJW8_9EURY|nr:hypothetical protein AKJ51_03030 [candidate division MSBL1 archaeon SCGC-AAA382A20]